MAATLFLICGLPGSGKTTLAKGLEQEKHALRLSPDEWISAILKDPLDHSEMDRLRSPIETLQWNLAKHILQLDTHVILENGFWVRSERLEYLAQARALGVHIEVYYFHVPLSQLWLRLSKRNASLPEATFIVTKEQLELWYSWFEVPQADELALYDAWQKVN